MSMDVSSDENAMQLKSLSTPRSRRQVQNVQDAFSSFWNQTKFQQITPPFDRIEVAHLIQIAAEYVVYIHRHLAPEGVQLPVLQGCASELIWEMDWNPSNDPRKFVRALVHSAFKNQNGYVADLTENVIDEYIDEINDYYSTLPIHNPRHPCNSYETDSKCDWTWTETLAKKLLERLVKIQEKTPLDVQSEYHSRWMKLCRELENANQMLDEILEIKEPESPKSPKTPATPHQARKARRKRRRNKLIASKKEDNFEDNFDQPKESTVTFEETKSEKTYEDVQVQPSETEKPQEDKPKDENKEGENQIQVEEEPEDSSISLQIGKVSEDLEKRKQDIKNLIEETTLLQDDNDPESAEQLVTKLQRRCLESSEYLMRNLLALDQLIVSNPKQRQQRKAQVLAIQDMLDTTDRMSQQLSSLLRQYKSQREKEKQEEEKLKLTQEPQTPKSEESKKDNKETEESSDKQNQVVHNTENENKVAVVPEKTIATPQSKPQEQENIYVKLSNRLEELAQHALQPEVWKKVKMEPQFQAIEQPQSYVIQGHLPGVNTKDISVDLSEDETVLLLSGCRVPSTSDVSIMLSHLVQAIRQGSVNPVKLSQLSDEQLLLLVGSGRFGSFLTKYRLPENVDKQAIQAKMDRGVLKIILPKLQPRLRSIPTTYNHGSFPPSYGFPSLFGHSAWPGVGSSLDELFW